MSALAKHFPLLAASGAISDAADARGRWERTARHNAANARKTSAGRARYVVYSLPEAPAKQKPDSIQQHETETTQNLC